MAQAAKAQSFSSVLDTPVGDIERPKPAPVGSYVCVVQGQPKIDKSAKKRTEYVEYALKPLEALDDVDEDALADWGIKDKTFRITFYITEKSIYRLKEFLEHCGVDMNGEGSMRQYIAEAAGKQVVAHIVHEASKDGSAVYGSVKSTTAVE